MQPTDLTDNQITGNPFNLQLIQVNDRSMTTTRLGALTGILNRLNVLLFNQLFFFQLLQ